jgi:uncharacterized membrane protein YfcA
LDATTLYVIAVIFVATLIRSTLGFGEALVAVPLLALRMSVKVAAPLAVLVSILVAAVIVAREWRKVELRAASWLIVSALCGIPLGVVLVARGNEKIVKAMLGVLIMSFSLYSLTMRSRLHLEKDHLSWLLGAGFCSGILGGAYGMNGPPLAVYGALRRWSPQHFRATLQGYFLPVSVAGMCGYAAIGLWTWEVTRYFLMSMPGAVGAILIGRLINDRLRDDSFFRAVYVGLIVIGGILAAQAILDVG